MKLRKNEDVPSTAAPAMSGLDTRWLLEIWWSTKRSVRYSPPATVTGIDTRQR